MRDIEAIPERDDERDLVDRLRSGDEADLSVLLDPAVVALALALGVVGVATKAVGGLIGARSLGTWSASTVGFGMALRGEVGIVVANLALVTGVVDATLFAAILVAVC